MSERCKQCGRIEQKRDYGIDFEHRAVALLRHLESMGTDWLAIRVNGTGWEVVRPRTQQAILDACSTEAKAEAELASAKEQAEMLAEALHEFIDCARYDPHMGGGSTFMGWRQSDLKRAEERARQALATYREKN